jgi:hypothetical protein
LPVGEVGAVKTGRDRAIFLISRRWGRVKFGADHPRILRIKTGGAIIVEVVEELPHPIRRRECHLDDLVHIHPLG